MGPMCGSKLSSGRWISKTHKGVERQHEGRWRTLLASLKVGGKS